MAGLDHGPAGAREAEDRPTDARNARIGLKLFSVYFVFYVGFVVVNAFRPDWMEKTPVAGINLAVLYGFALILGALLMSFLYGWLCQSPVVSAEPRGDAK